MKKAVKNNYNFDLACSKYLDNCIVIESIFGLTGALCL